MEILELLRAFKRHYHKARELYEELSKHGNFSLQIRMENNELQVANKTPADDETARFVILMRRFLDRKDPLHYQAVWDALRSNFGDDIDKDVISRIDAQIEYLRAGAFAVNINGEDFSAERAYDAVAEGAYFHEDPVLYEKLQQLAAMPIVKPLFWHRFHEYTLTGFSLASTLFDIVIAIEKTTKYEKLHAGSKAPSNHCIYCGRTQKAFTSEEHIFPESLGNDELVLPRGYVCDECNNGILADLDSYLLKFEPIAMMQVNFVQYTKAGKLPSANFENLTMKRTGPRNITITPKNKTGNITNKKDLGDGWLSFSLNMRGRRVDSRKLGRALYKIALGTVALDHGHEWILDRRYDAARLFIRTGNGIQNNLLLSTNVIPDPQVQIVYQLLEVGTPVAINIYGVKFLFNLEDIPVMALTDELSEKGFILHQLGHTPHSK